MTDFPIEGAPDDLWGVPDFEGPAHGRPLALWPPRSKTLVPTCRHWRGPVDLLDGAVVFASAWFDRPSRGRVVELVQSPQGRQIAVVKAEVGACPWPRGSCRFHSRHISGEDR